MHDASCVCCLCASMHVLCECAYTCMLAFLSVCVSVWQCSPVNGSQDGECRCLCSLSIVLLYYYEGKISSHNYTHKTQEYYADDVSFM